MRVALFIVVAAVAAAVGFGYASWTQWQRYAALDERGRPADAVVAAKARGADHTTVRFTTEDGHEVTTNVRAVNTNTPGVGDRLPIVYDPHNPTAAVRDGRSPERPLYRVTMFIAGLAAAAVVVGIVLTIRARRSVTRPPTMTR